MRQFTSFEAVQLENTWASIGMYDGVHRGHQAILVPLVEQAHAAGSQAAVVTFFPHPMVVLRGVREPVYLTSPDERARLLEGLGFDAVITLPFDRAMASLAAEAFMHRMSRALGLRQLWVGSDFALGRDRMGDINALRGLGFKLGYTLQVADEVRHIPPSPARAGGRSPSRAPTGERISSSAIRGLLRQGHVREAAALLGRLYSIEGPVIHGDGRGRQLGFPTLNVRYWPEKILPSYGVYATWTWAGNERIPSVTSVGVRPTFDPPGSPARLEAYLIDTTADLYDQRVRVEFVEFLRPELRFDSAQALIEQMVLDTQRAREALNHAG
jgi:riboflavin kinase/FMN adenylyltransferase